MKARPKEAKLLQESVRPRHERLALDAQREIYHLEKALKQSQSPGKLRTQLEKYAAEIAKQSEVMSYLKEHNPSLSQKIQGLAKAHDELSRDLSERSL